MQDNALFDVPHLGRLRAALAHRTGVVMGLSGTFAGIACALALVTGADAALSNTLFAVTFVLALGAVAALAWRLSSVARLRQWLGSLPFRVEGLGEALSDTQAIGEARVELSFADTPAPVELVQQLTVATTREDPLLFQGAPTVAASAKQLVITRELNPRWANFPLHAWFTSLATGVLLEVHAKYPLARVTVVPAGRTRFEAEGD